MPVVVCPKCRAELDLDADDIGHRVECPGCLATFVATRPAEKKPAPTTTEEPPAANEGESSPPPDLAPPPEPPISAAVDQPPPLPPVESAAPPPPERASDRPSRRSGAPITLTCPACQGNVSVAANDLGHKVECPMCQQVFRAEDPDRRDSRDDRDSRRSSRREDDDEPRWRSSRRSRYRDDDDDDRPRRSRRHEDPYESPDPKAWVWQAKRELGTAGSGLEVLGWVDVAFGGLYILIGVLVGMANTGGGGGAPGWEVLAMTVGLGVSGIAMGGVKAFGGRNMKQVKNQRLAVVACIAGCLPIYVLACALIFFGPQYAVTCCPAILTVPAYIIAAIFGIMGLTKLFNRNVKKAFEVNRPQGDVDAV